MNDSVVVFGAGKIARGFLAHLLVKSGLELVFVEKNPALVEALNTAGEYRIEVMGHPEKSMTITDFTAIDAGDLERLSSALARASLAFTAVGGQHLSEIGALIAQTLRERSTVSDQSPLNIITCENWIDAAEELRGAILKNLSDDMSDFFQKRVGVTEAVVLRSAVEPAGEVARRDPLAVSAQDWWDLPVDAAMIKGGVPAVQGMRLLDDFKGLLVRKVFTYNAGNGTVSYLGYLKGYETIGEAVRDPEIRRILLGVYEETTAALCRKFDVSFEEQHEFTMTAYHKLEDSSIVDYIERNARDPMRKLGPNDRLVGPARLALESGIEPDDLATAVAAALHYDQPGDPSATKLRGLREGEGIDYVLERVCGLEAAGRLAALVKEKIGELSEAGWLHGR